MSMIELAERKARLRAFALYGFAAASLLLLVVTVRPHASDMLSGMWLGLTMTSILYITPLFVRLKGTALARLLDDEATRDHRRSSSTAGLWAALAAACAMLVVTRMTTTVSATDTARVIMTAAVVAALLCFATLELRAAR